MKSISIKSKVITLILLSLAILAVSISTFAIYETKTSFMEENFHKLESMRDSKAIQLEKFFEERVSDIKVLAKSENIKNLVTDLIFVHKELKVKGNQDYPVANELAQNQIQRHESFFKSYMDDYGYYDVFLICQKHGHVMYTAAKESDLGQNLVTGNLKTSALAKVWRKVKETKKISFVDMEPYAPSNGSPAMFVAAPVFLDGVFRSVLVFQISEKSINSVMQFRKGYGASQEDYLVGSDKLMRSDSFLDPKNHSLQASFANPDLGSVNTQAVSEVFSGRQGVKIINDYSGNKVLSAYTPIKISEDITWALISEIDESEVLTVPNEIRNIIILISLVVFILITIIAIVFINTSLVKPLKEFQDGLLNFFAYLNREKKEVELLNDLKQDEIGSMATVVNENIGNIQKGINEDNALLEDAEKVLARVKNGWYSQPIEKATSNPSLENLKNDVNEMIKATRANFEKVNSSLQEYANYDYRKVLVVDGIEKGGVFEHLIIDINKLRDAITEMLVDNKKNGMIIDDSSSTLLSNVDTLNQASNAAAASLEETAAALEEITGNVSSTTERISQMSNFAKQVTDSASQGQDLATKTTTAMDEINSQVSAINDAITVIDQIAFQTNILSLNAAVEAATAGESGKGFAVVAAEVRNLASRSADAAKEIKTLVENANLKANEGKSIADEMIEGYTSLNTNIDKTIELIGDVSNASKEQESGIVQINDAINSLDQQTQKNAEVANQTRGIAVNTSQIATKIVNNANEKEFDGKNSIDIGNNKSSEARSKATPVTIPNPTNKVTIPTPSNIVSDINRPMAASPSQKTLQTISSNTNDNDEWESF